MMSTEDLRQSSVEALHHAIGARRLRPSQAVLDSQCLAERVEFMGSGSILGFLAEDPIGELLAVIGEDGLDFDGCRFGQRVEEAAGGRWGLCTLDRQEDPTGRSGPWRRRHNGEKSRRPSGAGI